MVPINLSIGSPVSDYVWVRHAQPVKFVHHNGPNIIYMLFLILATWPGMGIFCDSSYIETCSVPSEHVWLACATPLEISKKLKFSGSSD